jgi:hypothetical protein
MHSNSLLLILYADGLEHDQMVNSSEWCGHR